MSEESEWIAHADWECGKVFVPEDLALGKMAEVEKALEDK